MPFAGWGVKGQCDQWLQESKWKGTGWSLQTAMQLLAKGTDHQVVCKWQLQQQRAQTDENEGNTAVVDMEVDSLYFFLCLKRLEN